MAWPHNAEVMPIGGGDLGDVQAFGGGYHGGVDGAQGEVVVTGDELGDSDGVRGVERLGHEVAAGDVAQEPDLGLPAEPRADRVGDLCDDERRHEQRSRVGLE